MNRTTLLQIGNVARRSVLRTARQPAQIVPALIFPMFLLAVNSSGLQRATSLPHFPTHSFLTFALAIPFMQGALFSVMNAGTDLARDVETGFLNRLALTPMRGSALLVGHMAGVMVLGMLQSIFYICFALAVGVRFQAGVAGAFVILGLASLIAAAFGMFGAFLALRTGSGESIQATFPFLFIFFWFAIIRGLFWRGGWYGRGCGYYGVPPAFEEWHRRAHGQQAPPSPAPDVKA